MTFVTPEGTEQLCEGELGQDLMRLAHANDVDLEGTKVRMSYMHCPWLP